jgi:hypothetical protein
VSLLQRAETRAQRVVNFFDILVVDAFDAIGLSKQACNHLVECATGLFKSLDDWAILNLLSPAEHYRILIELVD